MTKIVIDTMGADMGFATIVEGVAKALKENSQFFPILVGPAEESREIMDKNGIDSARYELVDAREYFPDAGEEELPFREGQILKVTDLLSGPASSLLSCLVLEGS